MDVLTTMMASHLDRYWYGKRQVPVNECVAPLFWRLVVAAVCVAGVVSLLGLAVST